MVMMTMLYVVEISDSTLIHGDDDNVLCGGFRFRITAHTMKNKSVILVPIKDNIPHYPRALFYDIVRVGAYFLRHAMVQVVVTVDTILVSSHA